MLKTEHSTTAPSSINKSSVGPTIRLVSLSAALFLPFVNSAKSSRKARSFITNISHGFVILMKSTSVFISSELSSSSERNSSLVLYIAIMLSPLTRVCPVFSDLICSTRARFGHTEPFINIIASDNSAGYFTVR